MLKEFVPQSDFVPAGLNASRWEGLEPLYRDLVGREPRSVADLERLILDRSDLDAATAEAAAVLHINMTCRTDDEATTRAYLEHLEHVQPRLKEVGFELDRKITASPHAVQLDKERYRIYLRNTKVGVELFRPENVPIETELGKLDQEYQQVCGAMTVRFRGEEKTLPQMMPFQEETDRAVREEAWRLVAARRYQDQEKITTTFDKMVELRHGVAMNAGFADFRGFMFRAKRRFEYTPEDCDRFAEGVEQVVVPALRRLNAARARLLKVDHLRPWDLLVDVMGRQALRPFKTADELVERSSRLFQRMEPSLGELFNSLRSGGCLDLETRKGKAPGGYQENRDWIRKPFIFMNAAGIQRDVETMVHEAGHAFHALLVREDPLLAYRADIPLEFAEVASMGMELTAHGFLDEFYPKNGAGPGEGAIRAQRVHLEQIATLLPAVAMVDQFQQWMYTHPAHTRAQRDAKWVELNRRFGPAVSWEGLEDYQAAAWHRILHLFSVPFYYIEYGIAQLGALQLWAEYRKDPKRAIAGYKAALTLGASRATPELYRAAGLEFDFGPEMIARIWRDVEAELGRLPA